MILAVDVGNSHITLGCLEGMEVRYIARMSTGTRMTEHEYAMAIRNVLSFGEVEMGHFEGAIVSSVVVSITAAIREAIRLVTGLEALVVGKGIKTGLDIRIDDPGQMGADLLVGAVAALHRYQPPMIVIDMGTATTISVIDDAGRFVGGAIAPGVRLSLNALSGGTSLLPHISLDAPKKCIGTNTISCMQSGSIFGTAAMLDGMIDRMEEELGYSTTVVATGGLAGRVISCCRHEIQYNENLLLEGLAVLWEKNRREKK